MATAPSPFAPPAAGAVDVIKRLWRWMARRSPLALLVVTPVVTVPLSAVLVLTFGEQLNARELGLPIWRDEAIPASLHYFDFWRTWWLLTAPGLLNLLVILWFFQRNGYIRVAAGLALVIALAKTFGVVLIYFAVSQSDLIVHEGERLMRLEVERSGLLALEPVASARDALFRLLATMWLFGAFAWGPSVLIWGLYNLVMDRLLPHLHPPQGRRQLGEPRRWGDFFRRR